MGQIIQRMPQGKHRYTATAQVDEYLRDATLGQDNFGRLVSFLYSWRATLSAGRGNFSWDNYTRQALGIGLFFSFFFGVPGAQLRQRRLGISRKLGFLVFPNVYTGGWE